MSFITDLRKTVTDHAVQIIAAEKALDEYRNSPTTKEYRPDIVAERVRALEKTIDATRVEGDAAIDRLVMEYIKGLDAKWAMIGSAVDDDDAKLLAGAFDLTAEDLEAMFDRHAGNYTMLRVITDYADKHDVGIERHLYTRDEKTAAARMLGQYGHSAMRAADYREIFSDDKKFKKITPPALIGD